MSFISVTPSAEKKINALCSDQNKYAVGLSLKGGGCAGFSYDWQMLDEDQVQEHDEVIDTNGGRLVVDKQSVLFLFGAEVDYVEQVFGSMFEIRNPNASSSCGCGESVNIDMDKIDFSMERL